MQKRGSTLTLKPVIEIVIAAIVIAAFFSVSKAYGTQEIYQKARIPKDIAMVEGTLTAFPGNAWVEFPYDVSKYQFDFNENGARVFLERGDPLETKYPYVKSGKLKPHSIDNPSRLFLSRNGGEFKVIDKFPPKLVKYYCGLTHENLRDQKIQFNPGPDVPGTIVNPVIESKVSTEVSLSLLNKETVYIELKKGQSNKFKALFYYNSTESRDLGCEILNKLSDKYPTAKISLIPSDELENKKDKTNLILELGDVDVNKIGSAIAGGINAYYG